jgi:hypothetical protein
MEGVSVIGLGYMGLPTAVLFTSKSLRVVGVDVKVAKIYLGLSKELRLGNLEAKRDWGLRPRVRGGYVADVATEGARRLRHSDWRGSQRQGARREAFELVGLDWRGYVKVAKRFFRPLDVLCLVGDCSKAKKKLGWEPRTKFSELVKIMVEEDVKRWERWLRGMCLTNDEELAERMRVLRDHGMDPKRRHWHNVVGFNYRMTNLQAALGVAQLSKIEKFVEKKRMIAKW